MAVRCRNYTTKHIARVACGQNTELQNVTALAVGQLNGCVMKDGALCGTIRRKGDNKSWQI